MRTGRTRLSHKTLLRLAENVVNKKITLRAAQDVLGQDYADWYKNYYRGADSIKSASNSVSYLAKNINYLNSREYLLRENLKKSLDYLGRSVEAIRDWENKVKERREQHIQAQLETHKDDPTYTREWVERQFDSMFGFLNNVAQRAINEKKSDAKSYEKMIRDIERDRMSLKKMMKECSDDTLVFLFNII